MEKSPSIRECSDIIVKQFLRPADQSEAVCSYRADLSRAFYQQFSEAEAEDPDGMPKEGTVTITEGEFRLYSRAWLAVTVLRDLMKIMEGFEHE